MEDSEWEGRRARMEKTTKLALVTQIQGGALVASTTGLSAFSVPLGLPDQVGGLPTAPVDRGDETQDRFRYQIAMGVVLLAQGVLGDCPSTAIWCEHHEDFLVELSSGQYLAIQIKTDSSENARWTVTDDAFVKSIKRFCSLEKYHGAEIDEYDFCSNAPIYVPGHTATDPSSLASSPARLVTACNEALSPASLVSPYKSAFEKLASSVGDDGTHLFSVIRKLKFRQGPALRGYMDTLLCRVIPVLPNCRELPTQRLQRILDELMRFVELASGIPNEGVDGVLAYIESNGRPANSIRGKCITIEAARTAIEQSRQLTFRYIGYGEGLPLGHIEGQKNVLHKKMRYAFLEGQFEPMWLRVISAERRLMEKALADPEGFEAFAKQLEGAVLTECKDIEAMAALEPDERRRGLTIYRDVLNRLTELAADEPAKVENEPKETLLGVAGMLSGSCRFAWGVSLEGDGNGS